MLGLSRGDYDQTIVHSPLRIMFHISKQNSNSTLLIEDEMLELLPQ